MSESKTKKASKSNAKTGQTVQLDFLPKTPVYPPELSSATAALVVVQEQDEKTGQMVPKTWVRLDRIVNPPDPSMNRYEADEWKGQRQSIASLGQKTPVSVRTVPEGFWLEDGRHRFLAVAELGWAYIKADVDTQGNAASSAVWRLEANLRRKNDRPLDVAVTLKEMMDPAGANLTQQQVADLANVSAATVSRILRLLEIPRDLAVLVGGALDAAWLEPVYSIRQDAVLLDAASAAIIAAADKGGIGSADDVHDVMAEAWTEKELVVAEHTFNAELREDAAWAKARSTFKPFKVKVPASYEGGKAREVVYFRDVQSALKAAQDVSDRLEAERRAEEERIRKKAAKQGKKVKTQPDGSLKVVEPPARRTVADRVPEELTKVQLDLLARFVPTRLAFPDAMLVEVLGRFVAHTSMLLSLQDIEAACRALGVPVPEKPEYGTRSFRFSRSDFLARWKKNPAEAWHMVAVALYFQARTHDKQLKDGTNGYALDKDLAEPRLPEWLTGKTHDEATAIAKQAIKDRDAGFKHVIDGATCDHCDEAATLRREGINVCRSDVFKGINKDPKALATQRLRRKEAKAAETASVSAPSESTTSQSASATAMPAEAEAPANVASPAEPAEQAAEPVAQPAAVEAAPSTTGRRQGRRTKVAAGA